MNGCELITPRLRLRPVQTVDAEATAALMNANIASNLIGWPATLSVVQARDRIERARHRFSTGRALELAILDRNSGDLLGWISMALSDRQADLASLGYWLGEPHQGRGLMTEAAAAAVPFAADYLGAAIVEARVLPGNPASVALLDNLGFQYQGPSKLFSPVRRRMEESVLFRMRLNGPRDANSHG